MARSPKTIVEEYVSNISRNPDLKFQRPEDHISNLLLDAEEEGHTKSDLEAEVGDLYMVIMRAVSRPS